MTTETKVIGGIVLATIMVIGGGVFLSTNQKAPPKTEVLSETAIHWHPHLTITIKGEKQEITKNIGLGAVHQRIHTHEANGIMHMEMSGPVTKDETKLGNFFRIWGKTFSSSCIFEYCNGKDGKINMLVNGKGSNEFENYIMKDGDKIEISYE